MKAKQPNIVPGKGGSTTTETVQGPTSPDATPSLVRQNCGMKGDRFLTCEPDGTYVRRLDGDLDPSTLLRQLRTARPRELRELYEESAPQQCSIDYYLEAQVPKTITHDDFSTLLAWKLLIFARGGRYHPMKEVPLGHYAASILKFQVNSHGAIARGLPVWNYDSENAPGWSAVRGWEHHVFRDGRLRLQWLRLLVGGLWQLSPSKYGGTPHGIEKDWFMDRLRAIRSLSARTTEDGKPDDLKGVTSRRFWESI